MKPTTRFLMREVLNSTNAMFPLTPALSLGERETRIPVLEPSGRSSMAEDWPLPEGEGRGEGEQDMRTALQVIFMFGREGKFAHISR
jgi:hypothetical protein